jgi:steroid 5-alpha reductase family enzyme
MLAGFAIAYHSDATLIHLKKSTGTYQIPQGGLFQYVSCPHFLGEILEWTGFCIASNFSWATLSFLVWTSCNLIPRALAQDEWYHATFPEEYKKLERRAIVPYLL